jgi:hypothetical protein
MRRRDGRLVTAWTCAWHPSGWAGPALAGIKHLNRLENVLSAAESASQGRIRRLLLDASKPGFGGRAMSSSCAMAA